MRERGREREREGEREREREGGRGRARMCVRRVLTMIGERTGVTPVVGCLACPHICSAPPQALTRLVSMAMTLHPHQSLRYRTHVCAHRAVPIHHLQSLVRVVFWCFSWIEKTQFKVEHLLTDTSMDKLLMYITLHNAV